MLAINGFGTVSCLGSSLSDARELLRSGGVAPEAANKLSLPGIAPDSLREADLSRFDTSGEDYFRLLHAERIRTESRSIVLLRHAMAELAPELDAAFSRFGKERTACVIGTSTASLSEAERSLEDGGEISFDFSLSDVACMSDYVRDTLEIKGPCWSAATACTSSARALISAAGLIEAGIADAVIAGGVSSVSRVTAAGFKSLGVLSSERCLPFHRRRQGINIGEAAVLTVITREPLLGSDLFLAGFGATADGFSVSAPAPDAGLQKDAVREAMRRAGISPEDLGCAALHGTGTAANDAMESRLMHDLLPEVPAFAPKYYTGHTLSAAGAMGVMLSALVIEDEIPIPCLPYAPGDADPALPEFSLVTEPGLRCRGRYALSDSFAFGGNNASVIIGTHKK